MILATKNSLYNTDNFAEIRAKELDNGKYAVIGREATAFYIIADDLTKDEAEDVLKNIADAIKHSTGTSAFNVDTLVRLHRQNKDAAWQ